jgi:hypothetical protein
MNGSPAANDVVNEGTITVQLGFATGQFKLT